MDSWVQQQWQLAYDQGALAAKGQVHEGLLAALLADDFFQQAPPKSTGRDYFQLSWLASRYDLANIDAHDVLATLLVLTATSIAHAVLASKLKVAELIVCGGGALNVTLMARLQHLLPSVTVRSIDHYGVAPQWIEAMGMAWLAHCRVRQVPVPLAAVTGASADSVPGVLAVP